MISVGHDYYSLAKEIARIILTQSYQTGSGSAFRGVHDVLLFGSVLREQKGRDIDMLLLHNLPGLREFHSDTYGVIDYDQIPTFYSDAPEGKEGNMRTSAWHILRDLGCPEHDEHRWIGSGPDMPELEELLQVPRIRGFVMQQGWTIVEPRELVSYHIDEETLREIVKFDETPSEPPKGGVTHQGLIVLRRGDEVLYKGDPWPFDDQVYELWHDMHVSYQVAKLLGNHDSDSIKGIFDAYGFNALDAALDIHLMEVHALQSQSKKWQRKRKTAMHRCKDPTFWFTVLSEGRLYDFETNDFTKSVSEKYPTALDFFAVK